MEKYLIKEIRRIKKYAFVFAMLWSFVIVVSTVWDIYSEYEHTDDLIINIARSNFNKDQAVRFWASKHGGVYVKKNERTPPNKYLSHIPLRDIIAPNGDTLTLMNPAYIIRQMFDEFPEEYGAFGRIISLKPLNPINKPDEWETKVLKMFENKALEYHEFTSVNGEKYLRFLSPMITEESCLKCHAHQGYKVGNVRGGVEVSVKAQPYYDIALEHVTATVFIHSVFLFLGIAGVYIGAQRMLSRTKERNLMHEELRQQEARFREFIDSVTDIYFALDENLNYIFWNKACEHEFGLTTSEVIGKSWYKFAFNIENKWLGQEYRNIIKTQKSKSFELVLNNKSDKYQIINAYPITNGVVIYIQDITNIKKAERALIESEKQLSLIFNNSNDFITLFKISENQELITEMCNKKVFELQEFTGIKFTYTEIIGANLQSFLKITTKMTEGVIEMFLDRFYKVVKEKETISFETTMDAINSNLAESNPIYIHISIIPILNDKSECTNILYVLQDITEQRLIQKQLSESEEKFRKYFDLGLVGMGIFSPHGEWVEFNNELCDMFGYSREEFKNMHWKDFTHPDDISKGFAQFNAVLEGKINSFNQNKRYIRKDGEIVLAEVSTSAIRNENNQVDYFIVLVHDITQVKKSEEELIESEFRYRTVADYTYNWEYWEDENKKLKYVSPACESITGYSAQKFIKDETFFNSIIYPEDLQIWKNHKDESIDQICGARELEFRIIHKNGRLIWINHICRPVIDNENRFLGYRATNRDVTIQKESDENLNRVLEENQLRINELQSLYEQIEDEQNAALNLMEDLSEEIMERKKTEKELALHKEGLEKLVDARTEEIRSINRQLSLEIDQKIKAEKIVKQSLEKEKQVNELKTRFISTVSHEIRTPLTAIKSSVDLLKIYSLKKNFEKHDAHLARINKSIDYLVTLVEDVLTISRSDTGQLKSKPENVKINELMNDLVEQVKYLDDNKHIISLDCSNGYIVIDPKLIRLIFNNLVTNAIKYSPENSEVHVNVNLEKDLTITVTDSGIGIPEEGIKLLFEPFYRAENSEKYKGSGLGLSIVKKVVDMLSGTIEVESELGKGSKFVVNIPNIIFVKNVL